MDLASSEQVKKALSSKMARRAAYTIPCHTLVTSIHSQHLKKTADEFNLVLNSHSSSRTSTNTIPSTQAQPQMKSGLFLDVVVRKCPSIFQLLASEDKALLIWRNSFLVLDFGLDVVNCVRCLHIESDGLACQSLHKDLHAATQAQHQ